MSAYKRSDFPAMPNPPSGVPSGPVAVSSAVVTAAGSLTFTGLDAATKYVAYAQVVGQDRYVQFRTDRGTTGGLGSGAARIIDVSDKSTAYSGNVLTADTAISFTGVTPARRWLMEVKQDAAGGRKVTWSGITWQPNGPPPLSTAPNAVETFEFWSPDGTTVYGEWRSARANGSLIPSTSPTMLEPQPIALCTAQMALVSGSIFCTEFTPDVDTTIANLMTGCGGTLASGLTLARLGIYSVNGTVYTCVARTATDTGLWAALVSYTKAIVDDGAASPGAISNVLLRGGQRYALAQLAIGTTMPQLLGINFRQSWAGGLLGSQPRKSTFLAGQTDLPAAMTVASSPTCMWGALT